MSEKDIQHLIDLAQSKIDAGVTYEDAMSSLIGAGILDKNGEYTAPYQELLAEAGQQA